MTKRKPADHRKTRTREHIIGDLAVNQVERQILLCGFTMEHIVHDYGYDALVFVYNENGEPEPGLLYIQVKATEKADWIDEGKCMAFRVEKAHLQHWLAEPMPVILCVYEGGSDTTVWLYVQKYFENLPNFNLFQAGQTVTVHIPKSQSLSPDAVAYFATRLESVRHQIGERVRHD